MNENMFDPFFYNVLLIFCSDVEAGSSKNELVSVIAPEAISAFHYQLKYL